MSNYSRIWSTILLEVSFEVRTENLHIIKYKNTNKGLCNYLLRSKKYSALCSRLFINWTQCELYSAYLRDIYTVPLSIFCASLKLIWNSNCFRFTYCIVSSDSSCHNFLPRKEMLFCRSDASGSRSFIGRLLLRSYLLFLERNISHKCCVEAIQCLKYLSH